MDTNKIVQVKNRNNGTTGYSIPDRRIWRNFAPGEVKKITVDELQSLQFQPGGEYLLQNLLEVMDEEALKFLNMEVEPEYHYTNADIHKILFEGSIDELKDFLDFAPGGCIEICKEMAVSEELPDTRKRDIITEFTGFNITNAINVNHIMATSDKNDESAEDAKTEKKRRVVVSETKQRRTTPADKKVPKEYNVIS